MPGFIFNMNSINEVIVFIDGNNLYHNLKKINIKPNQLNFKKFVDFICNYFSLNLKEVKYYNSIPTIKEGKEIYFSHLKFIDKLRRISKFHVITRKLQFNSTKELLFERKNLINSIKLCNLCKPIVEENFLNNIGHFNKKEKGIDVKLAVDLISSSFESNLSLLLISGDADFIPALELAKNKNSKIYSAFLSRGYSRQLRNSFSHLILNKNKIIRNCLN